MNVSIVLPTVFSLYDIGFRNLLRRHQLVFGLWCVLSMLLGLVALKVATNTWWYMGLMTLSWALVNTLVLWWLILHTCEARFLQKGEKGRRDIQRHVERMFLLNTLLDVGYVLVGLLLLKKGRTMPALAELWNGFGLAVVIQGSFLCLQDSVFLLLHRANFKRQQQCFTKL